MIKTRVDISWCNLRRGGLCPRRKRGAGEAANERDMMHACGKGERNRSGTGFPSLGVRVPKSEEDEIDLGLLVDVIRDETVGTRVLATLPGVEDTEVELSDGVMKTILVTLPYFILNLEQPQSCMGVGEGAGGIEVTCNDQL